MDPAHDHEEHVCHMVSIQSRYMIHEILPVGMLQCNCSVFGDEQTREALVVDPGDEIERDAGDLRGTV